MTRFCPDCGTPHECEAFEADKSAVTIARINADRDVKLAEIGARAGVKIAETEAEHSADFAEGKAEGLETAIGGDEPDPEPEGGEIVVDTSEEAEPEADPEPEGEPEVVEVPDPAQPKRGGYWGAYR